MEEDALWELVNAVLKANLWQAVKADGRLVHRHLIGIQKHWDSMVSPCITFLYYHSCADARLAGVDEAAQEIGLTRTAAC